MSRTAAHDFIRIRGARQHNLKGFDLDLPKRRLIVFTGLSGSGKSSLAFDTLYAEGQRRYIETFSPYARQFFDRMDKPRVDAIEGIPPAIALEQRNSVRTTRSTVGTMTEACDHLKVIWPHVAQLHCRQCGEPVRKDTPAAIWSRLQGTRHKAEGTGEPPPEVLVTFRVPLSDKLALKEQLDLVAKQGFRRLLVDGKAVRLEDAQSAFPHPPSAIEVVQDRVKLAPASRARFVEACEQAYHFGHGRLWIHLGSSSSSCSCSDSQASPSPHPPEPVPFSSRLHCAACDLDHRDPTPALFSFNNPVGACPQCKGFGRVITIDYDRAIPDRSRTLAGGAVKPWQTGQSAECQADLVKFAKKRRVPLDVPFQELTPEQQRWVIEGDEGYGTDKAHEWPNSWYGVKGYFRWLESKAYKMHVRVLLARYRAYGRCPVCQGRRLQPEALLWRLPISNFELEISNSSPALSLADFYALPIRDALALVTALAAGRGSRDANDPVSHALAEVRSRLAFLDEVGLGYLTLDRPTRTLSGGETQRVNLAASLGSRLANTLFVLDEPSVGLHARDTARLVRIILRLRDAGNTVLVVEHEAAVMRAADQIVDLGPGHGATGGEVVFQGGFEKLLRSATSLTGQHLAGTRQGGEARRRPVAGPVCNRSTIFSAGAKSAPRMSQGPEPVSGQVENLSHELAFAAEPVTPYRTSSTPFLELRGITRHNLRGLDVDLPLGRLVVLSGVSGSGKTTLVGELLRLLRGQITVAGGALDVKQDEDHDADTDGDDEGGFTPATLAGHEALGRVLLVDQSPVGRTPRSNPAVYTGAFDHLRELFAQTDAARKRGLNASAFSFNSAKGQCERCRGAGFEKIEMQFLSDIFIRCPDCHGRRYRAHILDIQVTPGMDKAEGRSHKAQVVIPPPTARAGDTPHPALRTPRSLSVADVLELSVDDALAWLADLGDFKHAARARERLQALADVGLGYVALGQPVNTLSGGESQRLKLAGHLAEAAAGDGRAGKPTLFIFDEPTTGLHFEDIRVLLRALQRLVDAGHSVLVIEHNLDVIRCADWVVDLGPESGADGGRVVVAGPPEAVAACAAGHTGLALREEYSRERKPPPQIDSIAGHRPARRA